jgi:hypothetical protein
VKPSSPGGGNCVRPAPMISSSSKPTPAPPGGHGLGCRLPKRCRFPDAGSRRCGRRGTESGRPGSADRIEAAPEHLDPASVGTVPQVAC